MTSTSPSRSPRKRALLALFLACAGALAALTGACKKQTGSGGAGPGASGSAAASSSAAAADSAAGPCANYASKLCEKAGGRESSTCQSIQTATELMPPEACRAGLDNLDFSFKKLSSASKSCDVLIQKLCAEVGPTTPTCDLVKSQTAQFPPDRCKLMLEHLPEVVASLKEMQDREKPLSADVREDLLKSPGASFGPANAKVQIVEFSDFQCPYCARAADVVDQIKEKYGNRVHFLFRQFPLTSIHPFAKQAAEAALAAQAQGKFWDFHDRLFHHQEALSREGLEEQAKAAGLDLAKFKKSLDEHTYGGTIDSDLKLGEKAQVDGTPTMFINGTRVPNPTSFEAVAAQIEAALKG